MAFRVPRKAKSDTVSEAETQIYTDGACRGNPGPGGWGVVLRYNGHEKTLYGAEAETTNNRMELMAAIQGLESLKRACKVRLTTDSQYVQKGIQEWMANWKKRGWKTAARKPVKNVDLWQRLDEATAATLNSTDPAGNPANIFVRSKAKTSSPLPGKPRCVPM